MRQSTCDDYNVESNAVTCAVVPADDFMGFYEACICAR